MRSNISESGTRSSPTKGKELDDAQERSTGCTLADSLKSRPRSHGSCYALIKEVDDIQHHRSAVGRLRTDRCFGHTTKFRGHDKKNALRSAAALCIGRIFVGFELWSRGKDSGISFPTRCWLICVKRRHGCTLARSLEIGLYDLGMSRGILDPMADWSGIAKRCTGCTLIVALKIELKSPGMSSSMSTTTNALLGAAEQWRGYILVDEARIGPNSLDMVTCASTRIAFYASCCRVTDWLGIAL